MLFRPMGLEELLLLYRTGFGEFPPRLPEQPYFYPVLNIGYATTIARDWNTTTGSGAGYVVEFELDDDYSRAFPVHKVGSADHLELWVPSDELANFNAHVREARLVRAYFSPAFLGMTPKQFSLKGKTANQQLDALREIHGYSSMDFHGEITGNHDAVFANFPFWSQRAAEPAAEKWTAELLLAIRDVWDSASFACPLGLQVARAEQ